MDARNECEHDSEEWTADMYMQRDPKRHPLFGLLKGKITIAPGTDLTEPADPDWGMVMPECPAAGLATDPTSEKE